MKTLTFSQVLHLNPDELKAPHQEVLLEPARVVISTHCRTYDGALQMGGLSLWNDNSENSKLRA